MRRRAPKWITKTPIAHRGLHDAAAGVIENTTTAFERAAEKGYAIELDVLPSKDGEAIVFHDGDLLRLCGRAQKVADLTADELAKIPIHGSQDPIPTLGDVLTQVRGRVPILVELKSLGARPGPLENRVAELLRAYRGPFAVQSFSPQTLAWFAAHMPEAARGQLSMRYRREDAPGLDMGKRTLLANMLYNHISRPDFIAYEVGALGDPAPRIARLMGLPLITWTIRNAEQWSRAKPLADNLIFEGFAA
ncbi:MAG: glycerophosphodiester phosphodiesterase [Alphaproteobacteria bacterium]